MRLMRRTAPELGNILDTPLAIGFGVTSENVGFMKLCDWSGLWPGGAALEAAGVWAGRRRCVAGFGKREGSALTQGHEAGSTDGRPRSRDVVCGLG